MSKLPSGRRTRTPDIECSPSSPLSPPPIFSPTVLPRFTHLKSWKTFLALGLVVFQIGCNAALLFVTIHTYRLGVQISGNNWAVNDDNIITLIELFSKLLTAITVSLGGWAMSQHWGRRLYDPTTGTGIAEFESLGVFQSFVVIPRVLIHIIRNRFISSRRLYSILACSSLLLQLYSTALVTLAIPILTYVNLPLQSYIAVDSSGFMADYINGSCVLGTLGPACLSPPVLTETALRDAQLRPRLSYADNVGVWAEVMTGYTDELNDWTNGGLWLGPFAEGPPGSRGSFGVNLYGLNFATIGDAISRSLEWDDVWDTVTSTIQINATIPILTSSCISDALSIPNISTVTIQNRTYHLPSVLPSLQDDQIVGHVINASLLLSFGAGANDSMKHCVLDLTFQDATLSIQGRNSTLDYSPNTYFATHANISESFERIRTRDSYGAEVFFTLWLEGMGWGETPSSSPLVKFLGGLPVSPYWDMYNWSPHGTLEASSLTMFGTGVSAAFSSTWLSTDGDHLVGGLRRNYTVQTQEFYLGYRSPARYFLMFVIAFESCFVVCCLYIITKQGWLPDWTDPTTLVVAALHSCPPSGDSLRVSRDGSLQPSSQIWNCSLNITEASNGQAGLLAITLVPSAAKSVGDTNSKCGQEGDHQSLLNNIPMSQSNGLSHQSGSSSHPSEERNRA